MLCVPVVSGVVARFVSLTQVVTNRNMHHQVAVARVLLAIWSRACREEDLKLGGTAAQVAHLKAVAAEPLRQAPAGGWARRSQRLAARRKRNLRISAPCRSIGTIQSS